MNITQLVIMLAVEFIAMGIIIFWIWNYMEESRSNKYDTGWKKVKMILENKKYKIEEEDEDET